VSGREVSEEIWRFWEIEPADSGSVSARLVVVSSCIVIRISFLGRVIRMAVWRDFVSVGPQCMGDQRIHAHECETVSGTSMHGGT
jgi:hypothetical protein